MPSKIVKKYKINPSTGFILKHNSSEIKLKIIKENEKTIPVDSDSLVATDQQVSIIKGVD